MNQKKPRQWTSSRAKRPEATQVRFGEVWDIFIIMAVGGLCYSTSLKNGFHLDDYHSFIEGVTFPPFSNLTQWYNGFGFRVVSFYSLALNLKFFGLNPVGFHLVNISIHLLNALVVRWISLLILALPHTNPVWQENRRAISLTVGLLFVAHPLATQSVTYIVQRMASLAGLFYFLSTAFFIKAHFGKQKLTQKAVFYILSVLTGLFAFFTKQNTFTLPILLLVIGIFLGRNQVSFGLFKHPFTWLTLGLVLVLLGLFIRTQGNLFSPVYNYDQYGLKPIRSMDYFLTQPLVLLKYVQLIIFPWNQRVFYDWPLSTGWLDPGTLIGFAGVIGLLVLAGLTFRRNRIVTFGLLWFFITNSIESGFVPIADVIFEHRTYLPSFGILLILAGFLHTILARFPLKMRVVTVALIIVGLSGATLARNAVWRDGLRLWTDNIRKSPNLGRPYFGLAFSYGLEKNTEAAISNYSTAIRLNPAFTRAYINRSVLYAARGANELAIEDLNQALRLAPGQSELRTNRGLLLSKTGQDARAVLDFERVLSQDGKNLKALTGLGISQGRLGQPTQSIRSFSRALTINPLLEEALLNRALSYEKTGRQDSALLDYSTHLRVNPMDRFALFRRGFIHGQLGHWEEAEGDFSSLLKIEPTNQQAREMLAYVRYKRGKAF